MGMPIWFRPWTLAWVPWLLTSPFARTRERRQEATRILELFLISGASLGDARYKVAELFSPPRVTQLIGSLPHLGAQGGPTFDLRADERGQSWDFLNAGDRRRCRERLGAETPYIVFGSTSCTMFSTLQMLSWRKMDPAKRARHGRGESSFRIRFGGR